MCVLCWQCVLYAVSVFYALSVSVSVSCVCDTIYRRERWDNGQDEEDAVEKQQELQSKQTRTMQM